LYTKYPAIDPEQVLAVYISNCLNLNAKIKGPIALAGLIAAPVKYYVAIMHIPNIAPTEKPPEFLGAALFYVK
jgi:hypothetical protein